jgi:hypothetical protein
LKELTMPAKSKSQERLMQAVAHNPAFAKKVGIAQKVGKEFIGKAEGGGIPKVEKGLKDAGVYDEPPAPKAAASAPSAEFFKGRQQPKAERDAGLRAALAKRGFAAGGSIDGCAQRGKTKVKRS